MKTFSVEIREESWKTYDIYADTAQDAEQMVWDMWNGGSITSLEFEDGVVHVETLSEIK